MTIKKKASVWRLSFIVELRVKRQDRLMNKNNLFACYGSVSTSRVGAANRVRLIAVNCAHQRKASDESPGTKAIAALRENFIWACLIQP
jgi:hypothetical protein